MFRDKEPVSPMPEAAFLTTGTDNITIGLIEGILEENHMPFLKQSRGSGDSVSYTHLDVYKRQPAYRTKFLVG